MTNLEKAELHLCNCAVLYAEAKAKRKKDERSEEMYIAFHKLLDAAVEYEKVQK